MAEKKITKKDNFMEIRALIVKSEMLEDNKKEQYLTFIDHELKLLDKKASSKSSSKNTEEQKEDTVKTEINEPQHKVEQAAPSQVEEEKEQEIPEQESTESEEQQPVHSDESAAPTEQSSSQPKPEPQGKTNDIVSKFTKGKGKAPEQGKPQTINLTNRNNK